MSSNRLDTRRIFLGIHDGEFSAEYFSNWMFLQFFFLEVSSWTSQNHKELGQPAALIWMHISRTVTFLSHLHRFLIDRHRICGLFG